MTRSRSRYINGLPLGFGLRGPASPGAVEGLRETLAAHRGVGVFKTHDVPAREFDAACASIPELKIVTVSRDFRDVVVSRYFYYRYHWPSVPALGPLPPALAAFFSTDEERSDQASLAGLLGSPVLDSWAREWAAFEGAFATPRALRLQYAGMIEGSEQAALERFAGVTCPAEAPFAAVQQIESGTTGRNGPARFFRQGRAGQWTQWFTDEEAARITAMAAAARANQDVAAE